MGWLYFALILASLFYSGKIILDYTGYALETRTLIGQFEQRAGELAAAAESEAALREEILGRLPEMRAWVDELQRQAIALRNELIGEQGRRQRLEMEAYKRQFKRKRDDRS